MKAKSIGSALALSSLILATSAVLAANDSGHPGTPESDLLSYLLFDGNFLSPLADLGYADARAREEELAAFFSDP